MIDTRGYSCPLPVLMVKQAVDSGAGDTLEVLADESCAVGNIRRFGENNGYAVSVTEENGEYRLLLQKK